MTAIQQEITILLLTFFAGIIAGFIICMIFVMIDNGTNSRTRERRRFSRKTEKVPPSNIVTNDFYQSN